MTGAAQPQPSCPPHGHCDRPRLSTAEREDLFRRAAGRCQVCETVLPGDFATTYLGQWVDAADADRPAARARCVPCALRLAPCQLPQIGALRPRQWQAQALPTILHRIYTAGTATLHAAPGAGKTAFAGMVFHVLREADLLTRLLVVVPNRALLRQWRNALRELGVALDARPQDGVVEHADADGIVVTYQALAKEQGTAARHAAWAAQHPTLVVLDEVHHLAENAAWGTTAVQRMVRPALGDPLARPAVLNATGTLFRSSNKQRISTVRYDKVTTDSGELLQAVADFSVPTATLIGVELRSPDLYAYGSHARLVDLRQEEVIDADIADLTCEQRSAVVRNAYTSAPWISGFASEAVRLLRNQQLAIGLDEPLKLLFIAADVAAARMARDALNEVTGQDDFARLVVSDEPDALQVLHWAARERQPCAIVAIRMVTEGFDCPQVATIAYVTNILARVHVAQMMARAMRITATERAHGRMLPAAILIPDDPELRKAFASALASAMHEVELPEAPGQPGIGPGTGQPRLPRYQLLDLSDRRLRSATVLTQPDGEVLADELACYVCQCREVGIPETYAPRVAVVSRRHQAAAVTLLRPADPRGLASRARIAALTDWMGGHLGRDPALQHAGAVPDGCRTGDRHLRRRRRAGPARPTRHDRGVDEPPDHPALPDPRRTHPRLRTGIAVVTGHRARRTPQTLVDLNGRRVHAFALEMANLGLPRLADALMTMLESRVWHQFQDGLGSYEFQPGEFDYFLSQQGVRREDVMHAVRNVEVKARLEAAMDERRTGQPDYRRALGEVRAANPERPGQPIEPFGYTRREAKALLSGRASDRSPPARPALGPAVRRWTNSQGDSAHAPSDQRTPLDRARRIALRLDDHDLDELLAAVRNERRRRRAHST
nr:DEAD/DEAH box helicase family protein [Kutzneria buriramensis]